METNNIKFSKLCRQGIRSYFITEKGDKDLYILAYFLSNEVWGWRSYMLYTDWLKGPPSEKIVGGDECRLARTDDIVVLYFEEDARHYESYKDVPNLNYFSTTAGDLVRIIDQWVKLAFVDNPPCEITITQKSDTVIIEPTKGPITFDFDIFIVAVDEYMKGFHSDFEGKIEKAGKIIFSHQEQGPNGIYRAIVEYAAIKSEKTFFPKSWDWDKVIEKVIEALKTVDLRSDATHNEDRIRVFPYTSEGIQLDILLDRASGQVLTVYPTYHLWKHGDLLAKAFGR
jgi:hypothetical protein